MVAVASLSAAAREAPWGVVCRGKGKGARRCTGWQQGGGALRLRA